MQVYCDIESQKYSTTKLECVFLPFKSSNVKHGTWPGTVLSKKAKPKDLQTKRSVNDKRPKHKRGFKFIIRLAGVTQN